MRLEEHEVAPMLTFPQAFAPTKEVVESAFKQIRRAGVARNVTAQFAISLIGANHHRKRVPAHKGANSLFNREIARKRALLLHRHRVDIRRVEVRLPADAMAPRKDYKLMQQVARALGALGGQQRNEGIVPLCGFDGVRIQCVWRIEHCRGVKDVHDHNFRPANKTYGAFNVILMQQASTICFIYLNLKHMKLDQVDLRILRELQADGSLSNVALARRVHLSPSPCLARVKALEATGVISRYVALVSAASLGLGLNVFISISLKAQNKEALADFEHRIAEQDEVMECYLMTGDSDYLIRVAVADMAALERFILEQLSSIPGIEKIRSSFALKQVRYKTALPLPAILQPALSARG